MLKLSMFTMNAISAGAGQCFYHLHHHSTLLSLRHALPASPRLAASALQSHLDSHKLPCAWHASRTVSSLPPCWAQRGTAWLQRRGVQTHVVDWRDAISVSDVDEESDKLSFDAGAAKREKAEEKKAKAERKATNSAAGMVSWRPRSEQELRQRLAEKEHEPEAIDAAVERMQELGMQSDQEFAELFAQSKWRQARWAPSRIRRELRMKGLSADAIDQALREVFGDNMRINIPDPDDDLEGVSADTRFDPRYHLIEGVRRQAELSRGLPAATRKRRLVMWLQRRGHTWDTIQQLQEHVDLS